MTYYFLRWNTIGIILIVANAIVFTSASVSHFEKDALAVVLLLVLSATIIFSVAQILRRFARAFKKMVTRKPALVQKPIFSIATTGFDTPYAENRKQGAAAALMQAKDELVTTLKFLSVSGPTLANSGGSLVNEEFQECVQTLGKVETLMLLECAASTLAKPLENVSPPEFEFASTVPLSSMTTGEMTPLDSRSAQTSVVQISTRDNWVEYRGKPTNAAF
jgi:hypothetical protein